MVDNYIEKVYAGLIAMNAGIRLGAPVEPVPWDYEKIREVYGEITGYLKPYKNFAADDDVNGPVYFLRAMEDKDPERKLTAQDVADAWLNYCRREIGMFWWGGEGVSTEHTAYLNLKRGIPAPESGSIARNGLTAAEQIGGQIFVDTWGLIWPGNPQKAAEYAMKAASVSHDGNGLNGAAFIAACIARAFETSDIEEILRAGLSVIPDPCTYRSVVCAVWDFYRANSNWRDCMQYLIDEWGYDKYGGVCHIIPNAGVCVLSLLYGGGDVARTIEIASMCGWDTDCNAGNVGTIVGVAAGLAGIPKRYREPINDFVVLSGISGYLNNMDLAAYAREVAAIGYRLAGEAMPPEHARIAPGIIHFDFELPGSTHGIRLSNEIRFFKKHTFDRAYEGKGSLAIIVDRILHEDDCHVYYKPFYRRSDFNDERYKPVFSPKAYSGQVVQFHLFWEVWLPGELTVTPYLHLSMQDKYVCLDAVTMQPDVWTTIRFTIPDTRGDSIDELGFHIQTPAETKSRVFGRLLLDEFTVTGTADYTIDLSLQTTEFAQITPFAMHQGQWRLEDGALYCQNEHDDIAIACTGNFYAKDTTVSAAVTPVAGAWHGIGLRVRGAERGYVLILDEGERLSIRTLGRKSAVLASVPFAWQHGMAYSMTFSAKGDTLTGYIDGKPLIQINDASTPYGMQALYCGFGARTRFERPAIVSSV